MNPFYGAANSYVKSSVLQANGKIWVNGGFTALMTSSWQTRYCAGRLNTTGGLWDGYPSSSWYSGWYGPFLASAIQDDGRVLSGGYFPSYTPRRNVLRWSNNEAATQSLAFDGSAILWLRGGSSPEVWRTSFDISTNGSDWIAVGAGTRTNGGWKLAGLAAPASATIRACGWVSGGGSSSWVVETLAGPPVITSHPTSRTNNAGTTATFTVKAFGLGPFTYQWSKDGVPQSDIGNTTGSSTSSLTLNYVLGGDAGGYSVVVGNSYGSVTSIVATCTVLDPIITSQPLGQNASINQTVAFSVGPLGTVPLSYQWRKSDVPIPGATAATLTLTNIQGTDNGAYDVIVTNLFGSVTSRPALLSVNLAFPDPFAASAGSSVYAFAIQPGGKILVGGNFTTLCGQPRARLGRLNPDGSLDNTFNPGASGDVYALAMQPDGKILVGGTFNTLAGKTQSCLGRLNSDGSLDTGFIAEASGGYYSGSSTYPAVYSLVITSDGKILVGGNFTRLAGVGRSSIGRLNPDGTVDTVFNPVASSAVFCIAIQPNGKILVGGNFITLSGQRRYYIGQLNADIYGSLDTTFQASGDHTSGDYLGIYCLSLQPNGKILIGGYFNSVNNQSRSGIGRLNADGSLDATFNPGVSPPPSGFPPPVSSLVLQADGRILVGGTFTSLASQSRNYLGRLNADGSLGTDFNPAPGGSVYALALQEDGRILAGGDFTLLAGQTHNRLGRLINTEAASGSLTFNGTTTTWLRGGTSPEVWRTGFETSTDGLHWVELGAGARIAGGWHLAVPSGLATNSLLRARGWTTGGQYNGSSWFVETVAPVNPQTAPQVRVPATGGLGTNGFAFTITGLAGQVVVVEAAIELVPPSLPGTVPPGGNPPVATSSENWTPIATNTLGFGPFYFRDSNATAFPWRFYRAVVRP